jgi:hypothetical protein
MEKKQGEKENGQKSNRKFNGMIDFAERSRKRANGNAAKNICI